MILSVPHKKTVRISKTTVKFLTIYHNITAIFVVLSFPRWRSRPKFSSDQTFQNKNIFDQTFQTGIHTFQTQVTSDQTFQTQKVSDQTFQTEGVLIRPSSDQGQDSISGHCPDLNQIMIRLRCARNSLIRERFCL